MRYVSSIGGFGMKVKRIVDDFVVEELPLVEPGEEGPFVLYKLSKRGLGTLEVIEAVSRRWNIAGRRFSYGGLKDRHASTIQYVTIFDGPERPLRQASFAMEPLGRLPYAYGPGHFRGNRFEVVLRDLSDPAVARAVRALKSLPVDGLPNYFDDQRFGSVGFDGGFIAEAWLKADYERAFRLAVAEPTPMDRPDTRDEKTILRECWNDWSAAKAKLGRSHARSLVTYLCDHPTDFRGAFARIRRELRSLYFSAFQSHLWNLILARLIERSTSEEQRAIIDFKVAQLPIHHDLEPSEAEVLSSAKVPLPASRTPLPEGLLGELALAVVSEHGLTWNDLRVKHLDDIFFGKGTRPAVFHTENLTQSVRNDELYPGRRKLSMKFELPKGAYATLVVKRITEVMANA